LLMFQQCNTHTRRNTSC